MKLKYDVFPKFYEKYEWVAEVEEKAEYFTGRDYYLKNFWRNVCGLVDEGPFSRQNKTFIGQRKLGKTAFLVRCYNVTFWEQDEVIPFYYCFPQTEEVNLREIAHEIAFKLLQQGIGFITKDQKVFDILDDEYLFLYIKKQNFPWFEEFSFYWTKYKKEQEKLKGKSILEAVWKLVTIFSGVFRKKCMLIIDEYQKTVKDLLVDGKSIACHESIGKIVNNRNILTLISGSQISMLAYRVLTPELRNRIPGETFDPLIEEEAKELILEYVGKKGYKGIEEEVYKLTGGNPYYIKMMFTPTNKFHKFHNKEKSWKSKEEVMEIYNFEMLHRQGEVYCFWEMHLNEKYKLLNGDPPEHKGLTMRLLKYIAEKHQMVNMDELREQFPQIENMREKIEHLRDADLLMDSKQSEEVYNFSDAVLPVVITKMHQKTILGDNKEETFAKYLAKWLDTVEKRISKNVGDKLTKFTTTLMEHEKKLHAQETTIQDAQTQIHDFKNKLANMGSRVNSIEGKINYLHGAEYESKVRGKIEEALKQGKGLFEGAQFVAPLRSLNVYSENNRKLKQLDVCGEIEVAGKRLGLLAEAKTWKKTVDISQAESFVKAMMIVQKNEGWAEMMCLFISESGLSKPAQDLLAENNVIFGKTSELFPDSDISNETTSKVKTKAKAKTSTRKSNPMKATKSKDKATKVKVKRNPVKQLNKKIKSAVINKTKADKKTKSAVAKSS